MKKIPLTQGKFALVDDEDFEFLSQWKWQYSNTGYACRNEYIKGSGRKHQKGKLFIMHRVINKTPIGWQTDHINRNRLDNRKINLRTVNQSINEINKGISKRNTSGYKGIWWAKTRNKWHVELMINGKKISLGSFKDIKDAIKIRKEAEKTYFGEYSYDSGK